MKSSLLLGAFFLATISCARSAPEDPAPEKPSAKAKPGKLPDKIDFAVLRQETGMAPIAISPKASTETDFQKENKAWAQRVIVQPAKERIKGQKWAEDAAAFLDDAAAWWWAPVRTAVPTALANKAGELRAAGCHDPGVLYLGGLAVYYSYYSDTAGEYFDEVLKAVDDGTAPGAVGLLAASIEFNWRKPKSGDQFGRDFIRYLETALKDGSITEKDAPILVRYWCTGLDDSVLRSYAEPLAASIGQGSLPKWAQLAMLGSLEVQLAWEALHSDQASDATPENLKKFQEHLTKARTQLKESWKLEPTRPEAAAGMIEVLLGLDENGEDTRGQWFERATAAQFDYEPAYDAMLHALHPRWHGSYAHLLAFGDACLATKRFDTRVPGYFLTVLEGIGNEIHDWRPLYREPEVASRVAEYINANLAEPSHSGQHEEWEGYRAAYAWICGDFPLAARLMPNATLSPDSWGSDALKNLGVDISQAFNESLIRGGPARSDFEAGQAMCEEKRWDDARTAYRAAREKSSGRTSYIDGEIGIVDFEQAFDGGDWTKLPVGKGEAGWAHLSGRWTAEGSRITCEGYNEPAELIFGGRVPGDMEIRGHFAFSGPKDAMRSFCVLFGHSALPCVLHRAHWWTAQCWTRSGKGMAAIENGFAAPRQDGNKHMEIPDEADFHLSRHGGFVDFSINDEPIFTDFKLDPAGTDSVGEGPYIGIGASMLEYQTSLEITGLEVRKLARKL